MDDFPTSSRNLPLVWTAILLAIALVGVGLWTTRAGPVVREEGATRARPSVTPRPPMAIAEEPARGVNQQVTNAIAPIPEPEPAWKSFILPTYEVKDATLAECLELLRQQSVRLDPQKIGISFLLHESVNPAEKRISVKLRNVPLPVVLKYITDLFGLGYGDEGTIVTIHDRLSYSSKLYTREFRVASDFLSRSPPGGNVPGGFYSGPANKAVLPQNTARSILEENGVSFDIPGSTATFLRSSSKLVVRHTQQNIDLIESIIQPMMEKPRRVNELGRSAGAGAVGPVPNTVQQVPDIPLFK